MSHDNPAKESEPRWGDSRDREAAERRTDKGEASMDDDLPGMLAVAKGIAEQRFPHTMDAAVWAAEFMEVWKKNPNMDEGWMLTWFANAIMAGYDTAQSRAPSSASAATFEEWFKNADYDQRHKPECKAAWDAAFRLPPPEAAAHAELLAIHEAVMNPMEAKLADGDTFTVKMVKEFIARAVSPEGTDKLDAERYRWLRDESSWLGFQWRAKGIVGHPPALVERSFNNQAKPESIDAAVDALRRSGPGMGTRKEAR